MTEITRTTDTDTITYTLMIDGIDASELVITADTRKVVNIETRTAHQGEGHARTLWEHANLEAECFHALEHHRTDDGHAFAQAVGGETIDPADDYIDVCTICTGA